MKYWSLNELSFTEQPSQVRGTFPRFIIVADGIRHEKQTRASADRLLRIIYSAAPKVYVNAGKGITINFDI